MQIVDMGHGKKRKRGERIFGFHSFGDPACPADYYGAFRDNVRKFLEEYAEREDYNVEGMPLWSIMLREDSHSAQIPVFVIEESVHNSLHPHCDHCRCIGWSHHFVSNHRYHFIIPAAGSEAFEMGAINGEKVCPNCRDRVPLSQKNCSTCCLEGVAASVLDSQTHLLHGMIHSNGFGHLLCINGREAGSKYLSGREIMDLWDRMCAMLRARKVSVEDVAKKRSMELRLLHSVAYGESWYGRWGYEFGHGSFGITPQMYRKAIEAIRGMPLTLALQHLEEGILENVMGITSMYQRLSGVQILQTLGDLLRFMLELKSRLPLQQTTSPNNSSTRSGADSNLKGADEVGGGIQILGGVNREAEVACRWSRKRVELATQVIVEALKKCERKKMARQDVRDAARVYIGDTGLLDFVLKSVGNRVVGGYVVRRAVNPDSKVLEYSLEDVNNGFLNISATPSDDAIHAFPDITRSQVIGDILYFYKHILENYKPSMVRLNLEGTTIHTTARIILDTKYFIKDYKGETTRKAVNNEFAIDDDEMLRFMCTLDLVDGVEPRSTSPRPPPPPDLIVLPTHATIGDLKKQAQGAFRGTYYVMHNFHVDTILDLCGNDDDLLFGVLESGSTVIIHGTNIDMHNDLHYEGGNDDWRVDCLCGAHDDDGERMISCDMCEVWQHT
ncbi:hypothetical protein KI387_002795, partial [Taxus chinensis]